MSVNLSVNQNSLQCAIKGTHFLLFLLSVDDINFLYGRPENLATVHAVSLFVCLYLSKD